MIHAVLSRAKAASAPRSAQFLTAALLAAGAHAQTCSVDCGTAPICGGCSQTQTIVQQYRLPAPFLGQDLISSPPLSPTAISVPQFDPALGTLQRVQYRFKADFTNVSIHVRNNSVNSPCTINDTFSVQWTVAVQAPDGNTPPPLTVDTNGASLVLPGIVFGVNDLVNEFPFSDSSDIATRGRCSSPSNLAQVMCGTASTAGIDYGDERCRCIDPAPVSTALLCKEVGAPGSPCWNTWVGGGTVDFVFVNLTSTTGSAPPSCGKFDIDFRALAQYEVEVRYQYCPNLPPLAQNDAARTCSGVPVQIDVLANDYDRDSCGAPEPNGLVCGSLVVVDAPLQGVAVVTGCGGNQPCPTCRIVYTPPAGWNGTASFTYRVGDGEGRTSNTARVDVVVCSPVTAEDSVRVCAGGSCPVPVLANDQAGGGCAPLAPASLVIVQAPLFGTAVVQAGGVVLYTANAGAMGADSFRYRVSDTDGCQSAETLVRVEICSPPVANRDALCICPGDTLLLDVLANDLPGSCGPADPQTLAILVPPPSSSGVSAVVQGGRIRLVVDGSAPSGQVVFEYGAGYAVCGAPCSSGARVCVYVQKAPVAQDDLVDWDPASMPVVPVHVLVNDSASSGCTLGTPQLVAGSIVPPGAGTVVWDAPSSAFVFTPAPGMYSTVSFRYTLCQSCPPESGCGIACGVPCCSEAQVVLGRECPPFNRLQPGSLLLYPKYDSRPGTLTFLTVANTATSVEGTTKVEFRFIEAASCQPVSRTFTLSPNDTLTMLASTQVPGGQYGYAYAYAKNSTPTPANPGGEPVVFNRLVGQVLHLDGAAAADWSVDAVAFKGVGQEGAPNDDDGDGVRDLNYISGAGVLPEYEQAPEELHIPRFLGQRAGDATRVVLVALSGGGSFATTVGVQGWNDAEQSFSSSYTFTCWAEPLLTELAGITTESGLRSLGDDPAEILGMNDRESGWMTIRGLMASSSMETIHAPAIYAVLVERVAGFAAADLPFERCQRNGDLLPKGPLGDGPVPVAGDEQ